MGSCIFKTSFVLKDKKTVKNFFEAFVVLFVVLFKSSLQETG